MKIRCEVIGVSTNGESLTIRLQGNPPHAAEWRRLEGQEITIPATERAQKTFYVGRIVSIIIKAASQ